MLRFPVWGLVGLFIGCFSSFLQGQSLSYFELESGNYVFDEWDVEADPGTYPNHALFHGYTNEPSLTDEPEGLWLCRYDLTTRARINGLGVDGVSFFNTASKLTAALCLGENGTESGGFVGDFTVGLNTLNRDDITVAFTAALLNQGSGNPVPREYALRLQYRIGSEGVWNNLPTNVEFSSFNRANGEEETYTDILLPASCSNQPQVEVRWKFYSVAEHDGGTRPRMRLDDIIIDSKELDPEDPAIVINENFSSFEHFIGFPSAIQSFNISGENLTSGLELVTNPPFEIATDPSGTFETTLTLTPIEGTIEETTLYVRMNASEAGFYSNVISVAGGGVSSPTALSISGTARIYEAILSYPTPHKLSENGDYFLGEWDANSSSGSYPSHAVFHVYEEEPTENDIPISDWLCEYNLTARSRINGLGAAGFAFSNTASIQNESQCGSSDGNASGGFVGDVVVGVNTEEMENIRVSFLVELLSQSSGNPTPRNYGLKLMYRTNELSSWLELPTPIDYQTINQSQQEITHFTEINLPAIISDEPIVQLRWQYYSISHNDGGSRPRIRIDDILIQGDEIRILNPAVTVTEVLTPFHQVLGTSSDQQLILVEASDLIHPLELEVPYPFLISENDTANFSNTLLLQPNNEVIEPTPLYITLNALEIGVFERELIVSSGSLSEPKTITLLGETHDPSPTPQLQLNTDSLLNFNQELGAPSSYQFLILNGIQLESDLTVLAEAPFEIATSSDGEYHSSITLNEENGNIHFQPLFVRLNAQEAGSFSNSIFITGGGLTSLHEIYLEGQVISPPLAHINFDRDSLTSFVQEVGTPSAVSSISLEGIQLNEDIVIDVDSPFELSTDSTAGFSQQLVLSPDDTYPKKLYIRLNATSPATFSSYLIARTSTVSDTCYLKGVSNDALNSMLLYYWHFNELIYQLEEEHTRLLLKDEVSANYAYPNLNASLRTTGFADSRHNEVTFPVSNQNLQLGVPPHQGGWLRVHNPSLTSHVELAFETTHFKDLELEYLTARNSTGPQFQTLHYSIDNGNTWELIQQNIPIPILDHVNHWQHNRLDLSAFTDLNDTTNVLVKITFEGTNATAEEGFTLIDNLTLKGILIEPQTHTELTVSPIYLSAFQQEEGTPSTSQSFIVEAKNTTGAVSILSPDGFEVKLATEDTYENTINVITTEGALQPTAIDVRMHTTVNGFYSDNITLIANGVTQKIPVYGFCNTSFTPITSELIYYWHFNHLNTLHQEVTQIQSDYALTDSVFGLLTYEGAGIRNITAHASGSATNLQLNQIPGQSIAVHNTSTDRTLRFDLPTEGLSEIVFEYVVKRSFEGMLHHTLTYSTDGMNYQPFNFPTATFPISEYEQLLQFDFSELPEVANNPNFKIRILFTGQTSLSEGYNTIDNITLKANASKLGIQENNLLTLDIYPNPCTDELHIQSNQSFQSASIFTTTGTLLYSTPQNSPMTTTVISTGNFASGMYIITLYDQRGVVGYKRFVKE